MGDLVLDGGWLGRLVDGLSLDGGWYYTVNVYGAWLGCSERGLIVDGCYMCGRWLGGSAV